MSTEGRTLLLVCLGLPGVAACSSELTPQQQLVERGRRIFFEETFAGNGRTCSTCHRPEDNYKITPEFIATLPPDDPLFVAETVPELSRNFEKPDLMRRYGLILMNPDGADNLEQRFVMRTVQSLRSMRTSIGGSAFEGYQNQLDFQPDQTGWAGDGAPGDGTLRSFAIGAIRQHMTRSTDRVPGIDFRLPTAEELDALEAFMLTLGRQEELSLPLPLRSERARRGQQLFLDVEHRNARCSICHINAGASSMSAQAISEERMVNIGNVRHSTGEERLPGIPNDLIPRDDGFGIPGEHTFNTPPLVEAADSGRLFHNGAVASVEEAVAIYNLDIFNQSETGSALARRFGQPTNLSAQEVLDIGAFLRVINATDNLRESLHLIQEALDFGLSHRGRANESIRQAWFETEDAIQVLQAVNLHPLAVAQLKLVLRDLESAGNSWLRRNHSIQRAQEGLRQAALDLVEEGQSEAQAPAARF